MIPPALQKNPTPPITHPLVVSAQENKRLLFWITVFLIAGAVIIDVTESGKPRADWIQGDGFLFYLLGWMTFMGALVCWYQSRISEKEFTKIAEGEYLAHWEYTPGQWEVFKTYEIGIQSNKSKTIFYLLVILFGLLGLAGGILAAMNKSPMWVAFAGLPAGITVGIAAWAVCILPFKVITNTYNRILNRRDIAHEVIFTEKGVYSTGRFFQVNDVGYEEVESGISEISSEERSAPAQAGILWIRVTRSRSHGASSAAGTQSGGISHVQRYVIPAGQEEIAGALVKMYPPE